MPSPNLKDLFISKVRVKLLTTFLTRPNELLYVRQLVRITHEEINAVRRELAHMETCGLVSKEKRGNRLYYLFRRDYLFHNELVRMIAKTTGLGQQIIERRNQLGRLDCVAFSGNFTQHLPPQSPNEIDVLIIGDVVLPEVNALIQTEEAQRKREINYTVMNRKELQTRKTGKDPFLLSIFAQSRIMIIGDEEKLIN
jgi:predicted transcriptional regulator